MTKKITYLSVSAYKEELMPNDTVEKVNDFLQQMGMYITNLEVALNMRNIDENEVIENPDTPDTSTYTEQAYPAPAEEPEQPKDEPKEEPKEETKPAGTVTKDELRYTLMKFRDAFGKEALRDLYERLGKGALHLSELSEDCYEAMNTEADKKLGEQNA
jgi:hypothetical protein